MLFGLESNSILYFYSIYLFRIPAFEPLDLSIQESEHTSLTLPSTVKPSSSTAAMQLPCKSASFNESLPSLGMSELENLRHIPKAAGPTSLLQPSQPSQSQQPLASKSKSFHSKESKERARGRLLCCLKVEIKSGEYKMLPVHEVSLFELVN